MSGADFAALPRAKGSMPSVKNLLAEGAFLCRAEERLARGISVLGAA
jgi:hypothetical protein